MPAARQRLCGLLTIERPSLHEAPLSGYVGPNRDQVDGDTPIQTATETYIARWWQSNPVASWNDVARQLIARNHLDALTAHVSSRCRTWWQPTRRSTPERQVPLQPLAAVSGDPQGWRAGRGQSCYFARPDVDAAAHGALPRSRVGASRARRFAHHRAAEFFGNAPAGGYQITSFFANPGGPATRSFSSFSQAVDELVEARIWAGLHFRTADVQGAELGENIANFAMENFLQ